MTTKIRLSRTDLSLFLGSCAGLLQMDFLGLFYRSISIAFHTASKRIAWFVTPPVLLYLQHVLASWDIMAVIL